MKKISEIFDKNLYYDKSAKKKINLLYNITQLRTNLLSWGLITKLQGDEMNTWLTAIETGLRNVLYEAISYLFMDIKEFNEFLTHIRTTPAIEAISDLTEYLDESGYITASKFVDKFKIQLKTNFTKLEKFEFIKMRNRFKKLVTNIDQVFERRINQLITQAMIKKLDRLYKQIFEMRDTLVDELDYLEKHLDFCHNLLESINLESFSDQTVNVAKYLSKHRDTFLLAFETKEQPKFPINIPHIQNLSEDIIMISTEAELKHMFKPYSMMRDIVKVMEQFIPQKWPQSLPNLSAHDGKPYFQVKNQDDYTLVLGAYFEYVTKMENLKNEWTFTVRLLYESLAATKCFVDKAEKEEFIK